MKLSECARNVVWPGGQHDFDLGTERAMQILRGGGNMSPGVPYEFLQRGYPMSGCVLEGQFGDTPSACLKRFQTETYSISDIERVIEIGLYGGGMAARDAFDLVDKHVRGKPLGKLAMIAYGVLLALFMSQEEIEAASRQREALEGAA